MPRLPLTPLGVERLFYFVFLGFAVLVTALVYAIQHSNIGWALVAIREDEDAAEIVGVRTVEVKWAANALACFIAGVVGGLYAQRIAYVEPIATFSFDTSLNVVLMAVIGGPGTWQGPLIGAPLVLLVADVLRVTFTSEVNRVHLQPGGDPDRAVHPGRRDGRCCSAGASGAPSLRSRAASMPRSQKAACFARISSAARSATMMVGRLVFALGTRGMIEASTTRRLGHAVDAAFAVDHRHRIVAPTDRAGRDRMRHWRGGRQQLRIREFGAAMPVGEPPAGTDHAIDDPARYRPGRVQHRLGGGRDERARNAWPVELVQRHHGRKQERVIVRGGHAGVAQQRLGKARRLQHARRIARIIEHVESDARRHVDAGLASVTAPREYGE